MVVFCCSYHLCHWTLVAFSPASFTGLHWHCVWSLPRCTDVVVFVFAVRVCHQSDVTPCITSCTGSWGCPCLLLESIQEVFYLATIQLILSIDCSCPSAFWLLFHSGSLLAPGLSPSHAVHTPHRTALHYTHVDMPTRVLACFLPLVGTTCGVGGRGMGWWEVRLRPTARLPPRKKRHTLVIKAGQKNRGPRPSA